MLHCCLLHVLSPKSWFTPLNSDCRFIRTFVVCTGPPRKTWKNVLVPNTARTRSRLHVIVYYMLFCPIGQILSHYIMYVNVMSYRIVHCRSVSCQCVVYHTCILMYRHVPCVVIRHYVAIWCPLCQPVLCCTIPDHAADSAVMWKKLCSQPACNVASGELLICLIIAICTRLSTSQCLRRRVVLHMMRRP